MSKINLRNSLPKYFNPPISLYLDIRAVWLRGGFTRVDFHDWIILSHEDSSQKSPDSCRVATLQRLPSSLLHVPCIRRSHIRIQYTRYILERRVRRISANSIKIATSSSTVWPFGGRMRPRSSWPKKKKKEKEKMDKMVSKKDLVKFNPPRCWIKQSLSTQAGMCNKITMRKLVTVKKL